MKREVELHLLSLDWATKIIGARLEIDNLIVELVRYVKWSVPAKRIRFLLWSDAEKRFVIEAGSGIKGVSRSPVVAADVLRVAGKREPLYTRTRAYLPLKSKDSFLGLLLLDSSSSALRFLKDRQELEDLSEILSLILSNSRLFIESEQHTQDMFRFNVLSRALNPTVQSDEITRILLEGLGGIIKFDVGGLLILGKQHPTLYIKSRVALSKPAVARVRKNLKELLFNLTKTAVDTSKFKEVIAVAPGKPAQGPLQSQLNTPIIIKDKIVGVLGIFGFRRNQFTAQDTQNISTLAAHGAVAFENAMLYEDLRRTYFSIIKALASAIEAKDEYTRGHSELVSKFSTAIAGEMRLSGSMVESIQIAGLLHDLGKIGVPEEILVKKGKLTDTEYEVVKAHPDIAMKILGPVEFPHFAGSGAYSETAPELTLQLFEGIDLSSDVKLMIYHHHERFSGGGYPKGLRKEEIPLGARILAVADTFEALTANRPYRKAFGVPEASKILRQISGEQLDPEIVGIFLKLIRTRGIESLKMQAIM